LSDVKAQALELLAEGLSTEEISRRLGVSKQTVAAYRAHVTMGTYAERAETAGVEVLEETEDARNLKFGLERDMQQALRSHIDRLDPHLDRR
jgi:transcriptional regulator with XRE-family HTH domain